MPLKSDGKGCYTATWVPGASGTYLVQVFIDNKHTGMSSAVIYGSLIVRVRCVWTTYSIAECAVCVCVCCVCV